MVRFRLIEGAFRDCCLKWGYQEVKTPTIEYLHLFTSAGRLTPSMLGKVYSFLDWNGWSGERVVLKPDGTIPVARLYIESKAGEELARFFYITNIFIFEETGRKTRERWQCGVELIGVNSPLADVELISLALEILQRLKVEGIELRLSHAGLIKVLLAGLGLSPEEQTKLFEQILEGNREALLKIKSQRPELENILSSLLNLRGQSPGFLENLRGLVAQSLPEIEPHLDNFINIVSLLKALGYSYQIELASSAGFEYYTGVIFQLFAGEEKIGGGGRYDDLIPSMGGGDVPASGFALYLDRLLKLVKPETLTKAKEQRILVKGEKGDLLEETFKVARRLREAGYIAELSLRDGERAEIRWTLNVRDKAPLFALNDRLKSSKVEVQTIEEVLALLEEKGDSKDSPT
jgi:histidyl-tRNA synthetase